MIISGDDELPDWRNWNPVRAPRYGTAVTTPLGTAVTVPIGTTSASGGILSGATIDVIADHTLPAGTMELRSPGCAPVRAINITPRREEE